MAQQGVHQPDTVLQFTHLHGWCSDGVVQRRWRSHLEVEVDDGRAQRVQVAQALGGVEYDLGAAPRP
eukprot:2354012-Prymnesium_polylepis.1